MSPDLRIKVLTYIVTFFAGAYTFELLDGGKLDKLPLALLFLFLSLIRAAEYLGREPKDGRRKKTAVKNTTGFGPWSVIFVFGKVTPGQDHK